MDYRKIFNDKVEPKDFDKFRFRYCDELFVNVISHSKLDATKTALEIGPGTGQATESILKTDCSYLAIELGENFTNDMKKILTDIKISILSTQIMKHILSKKICLI